MNAVRPSLAPVLLTALALPAAAQCDSAPTPNVFPGDTEYECYVGTSIAVEGDWMLVGEPRDDVIGPNKGAVYAFQRVGGVWSEVQKILGGVADDGFFGATCAMGGSFAVAGASTDVPSGLSPHGSAKVLACDGVSTWSVTATLDPSLPPGGSQYGADVGIDGTVAAVGCPTDMLAGDLLPVSAFGLPVGGGAAVLAQSMRLTFL